MTLTIVYKVKRTLNPNPMNLLKRIIRKFKTWQFNGDFHFYFEALLRSELTRINIALLNDMKINREEYLNNYLNKKIPIHKQLIAKAREL